MNLNFLRFVTEIIYLEFSQILPIQLLQTRATTMVSISIHFCNSKNTWLRKPYF